MPIPDHRARALWGATRHAPMPRRAVVLSLALGLTVAAALESTARGGAVHVVRMTSDGHGRHFMFEPTLLVIAPGNRVRFLVVDPGHNCQSIPGMVPEEGTRWRGGIGREIEIGLEVEGVYGFMCRAHYAIGMVGLVVVGSPHGNLAAARAVKHPLRPHRVFEALFAEVDRRFPRRPA